MLAYAWHNGNGRSETATPVVFLHGLLGSQEDWAGVLSLLQNFSEILPLTLDLPFHGNNQNSTCANFAEARNLIHSTLISILGKQKFYLIGYSLGGRLALDYALNGNNLNLLGTILEGTNLGLKSETERLARWQNDQLWANRFRTEPIEQVLNDWYQQPVFAHLDKNKRSNLVKKRQHNLGANIAQMLEATSLAKQADYSPYLPHKGITFLIGEQDHKFRLMAEENQLDYCLIKQAGHNAHLENPSDFVQKLLNIIGQR